MTSARMPQTARNPSRRHNEPRADREPCPRRAHIRLGLGANGEDWQHGVGGAGPQNSAGFGPNRIEKDRTFLGSNPTVTASIESRFSQIHSAETGLVWFEFGSIVATVLPALSDSGYSVAVEPYPRV